MKPPNVVVVLVDQLRSFEVGCYGNAVVRTPHIDQLAASGCRFDLGITNNPVCTPARSSLLTGQYSRTCTGEVSNVADDPPCARRRRLLDPTIAEAFREAGYDTALIGKWHVDPDPALVGFDDACFPLTIHRYRDQRFIENGVWTEPIEQFAPDYEMDKVDAFLGADREKPFFLFYNISLPHEPIGPAELPKRYAEAYANAELPLRENVFVDGEMAHDERWFKIYQIWDYFWRMAGVPCWNAAAECGCPDATTGELPSDVLPDGFTLRDLYALYYGATTCVDDLVGQLMAKLHTQGYAEDTVVLFASDHGDNLGSHHLFNKDCLFEESIRVPFILNGPGIGEGIANTQQMAQIIDVMPTLLELCGIEVPGSVQGQSLASVATGEREILEHNVAFIETDPFIYERPVVGIRTPTHVLGMHLDSEYVGLDGAWGFYDLEHDPLQQNDLLGSNTDSALRDELLGQLQNWNVQTPWLKPQIKG